MFLVVTLQHVLLCYVAAVVAGAGVGLGFSLEPDDWFATTQTRGKKKQTHLLEKSTAPINIKFPRPVHMPYFKKQQQISFIMYHFIDKGSDIMAYCNFALSVLEHCNPYSLYNKACV